MRATIRIEGMDELRRKVRAMSNALPRPVLVPIIEKNLQPMAADMRDGAPRLSGELAESVTVSTELSPRQAAINVPIAEIEVFAGPGPLPQAVQAEFGNAHQAPEPFIRPAYDRHVDRAMRGVATEGVAAILTAGKKG